MAAYAIQFRRGTTLEHSAFTGEVGEVTVDTDKNTLIVHDGTTPGGHQIALYSDISGAPSSGSSSTPGGASTTVSDTAPTSPSNGDFWYNSSTLGLFIYYNDGSSSQWVQVSGGVSTGETVINSDSQPTGVDSGDFWLDTTTLDLFVYYVDNSNNGSWVQVSGGGGSTGTGNEAYDTFATSTTYNPGGAVAHGSYIRNEADNADVAASVTVTSNFPKIKVELDASIVNQTDITTEMIIALERTVDGSNATTVKTFLFPVGNTFYGSQHFLYVDTHGASAGSTVEYKLKVDMSSYSNESARVQYGLCGDTLYIKEIK